MDGYKQKLYANKMRTASIGLKDISMGFCSPVQWFLLLLEEF